MNELLHKFKLGNEAELLLEKRGGGYEKVATVPIGSTALGVTPSAQGIGIFMGADQIAGNATPQPFLSRVLVTSDNGMVLVCPSAQMCTINAGMVSGFGVAFKGAISFAAGSGVVVSDVRTTGSSNPWCALVNTGFETYDIVGAKA